MYSDDDIQYALEATQVLHEPDRRIDTFGNTSFEFHLITELMDSVNKVCVRFGRIEAERPQIIRPDGLEDLSFEGFGDQAEQFAEWFKRHAGNISFLKYGFVFKKNDISENFVHEPLTDVVGRVVDQVRDSGNPMQAVIQGVDDAWEICLLKFTFEMIQKSQDINIFDFKRKGLL